MDKRILKIKFSIKQVPDRFRSIPMHVFACNNHSSVFQPDPSWGEHGSPSLPTSRSTLTARGEWPRGPERGQVNLHTRVMPLWYLSCTHYYCVLILWVSYCFVATCLRSLPRLPVWPDWLTSSWWHTQGPRSGQYGGCSIPAGGTATTARGKWSWWSDGG